MMAADILGDKFGRRISALARIDKIKRTVLKLRLYKVGPKGGVYIGNEFEGKYVLVMVLKPDMDTDLSLIKDVEYAGADKDEVYGELQE